VAWCANGWFSWKLQPPLEKRTFQSKSDTTSPARKSIGIIFFNREKNNYEKDGTKDGGYTIIGSCIRVVKNDDKTMEVWGSPFQTTPNSIAELCQSQQKETTSGPCGLESTQGPTSLASPNPRWSSGG